MAFVALALSGIGGIVSLAGWIWIVIIAFQENVGWGIGCLLCPPASLVYVIMHWEKTKKPFLIEVVGVLISAVAQAIAMSAVGPALGQ